MSANTNGYIYKPQIFFKFLISPVSIFSLVGLARFEGSQLQFFVLASTLSGPTRWRLDSAPQIPGEPEEPCSWGTNHLWWNLGKNIWLRSRVCSVSCLELALQLPVSARLNGLPFLRIPSSFGSNLIRLWNKTFLCRAGTLEGL